MNQINKTANLQLELFSEQKGPSENYQQKENNPFLSFLWGYEKAILIIIAMSVIGIISFSLGVEKGKRIAATVSNKPQSIDQAVILPVKRVPVQQQADIQGLIVKTPLPPKLTVPALQKPGSFTIQLATYKTKTNAQKEKTTLSKKGFSPMLITNNAYTVICVGNFSDKETARTMLSKLKKTYPGCYIRRL